MLFTCNVTDQMLLTISEAIVREVDPERIILFGSRARGDAKPDSDVDLLVIERDPFGKDRSRLDALARMERALIGLPVPTDILLYDVQEVEHWRQSLNHVIGRALREGKVLYARP